MHTQELRSAIEADVEAIATDRWFSTPEAVAAEVERRLAGRTLVPSEEVRRWQRSRRIGEDWTPWEGY